MTRSAFNVLFILLFIVGVFVMFNSVSWGSDSANAFLRANGGSMDTAQFMVIFQENIGTYRLIGAIASVIGGLGFLRCIKFNEKQKGPEEEKAALN